MSWRAEYIILIMASTLVDYIAGLQIYKSKTKSRKKIFLISSLFINLGLLFMFKYFNFFTDSLRELLSTFAIQLHPTTLKVLLPVGISFYTFQTIGYTIDVYRGKIKPERHLGIFACYVSFFPQLVAGPIERAKNLLPQFYKKHKFSFDVFISGLKLMLLGFFKKLVIADRLALFVDKVFSSAHLYTTDISSTFFLATILFGIQIYCDFSGYSDIAIGAARIMGFKLMQNFRRPYYAKSVSEFWRRWHISLSTWFRDYIYIPLGGNKVSKSRTYYNIFIVFLITGLWHGANWTFVVWGLLHGFYIILSKITTKLRKNIADFINLTKHTRIHSFIKIIFTFFLVNITWIFFRANSLTDAIFMIKGIFSLNWSIDSILRLNNISIIFTSLVVLAYVHLIQEYIGVKKYLERNPNWVRWIIYIFFVVFTLLFGVFGEKQFIYFQF